MFGKYNVLILAWLTVLFSCGTNEVSQGMAVNHDYNILMVGNSLTYTNNLPLLVQQDAERIGISLNVDMLAKPNYAIVDHWAEENVQSLIRSRNYDYVIIQQGPSSQSDGLHMLVHDAKLYADLCQMHDSQLVYFMVWPAMSNYHTFNGVIANYTAGSQANNALLCPVGKEWKKYIDSTQDYSYYSFDQFHPSTKGSKVAASIIVRTLFN